MGRKLRQQRKAVVKQTRYATGPDDDADSEGGEPDVEAEQEDEGEDE